MTKETGNVRFALSRTGSRGAAELSGVPELSGSLELGPFLVAVTDRGVSWLDIGDDDETLRARFLAWAGKRFPGVTPRELEPTGDPALGGAVRAVLTAIGSRGKPLKGGDAIPGANACMLDERGTDLQLLVWRALRAIPAGTTASYAEIARAVRRPRAARAVANACAANRIAILTPCHRAVRSDGSLGGYRWGIDRKKALLALESENEAACGRSSPSTIRRNPVQ